MTRFYPNMAQKIFFLLLLVAFSLELIFPRARVISIVLIIAACLIALLWDYVVPS